MEEAIIMFDENTTMQEITNAAHKGDKVNVLIDFLCETLEMPPGSKWGEIGKKAKECIERHREACKILNGTIRSVKGKKLTQNM